MSGPKKISQMTPLTELTDDVYLPAIKLNDPVNYRMSKSLLDDYYGPAFGSAAWGGITGTMTDQTDLFNTFVSLTGNQTVAGVKKFTSAPISSGIGNDIDDIAFRLYWKGAERIGIRESAIYTYMPLLPGTASPATIGSDGTDLRWDIYAKEIYASTELGGTGAGKNRIVKWDAAYDHTFISEMHLTPGELGEYLSKGGGTMSGKITLSGSGVGAQAPINFPDLVNIPGTPQPGDLWRQGVSGVGNKLYYAIDSAQYREISFSNHRHDDLYDVIGAGTGAVTIHTNNINHAAFVVGPVSAENDKIAVFDGTTGKLIKKGSRTIAEIENITGVKEDAIPKPSSGSAFLRYNASSFPPAWEWDINTYNNYVHPAGTWIAKTALSGASVISNLAVSTTGHITDWSIRSLTPANIGAEPTITTLPQSKGGLGIDVSAYADGTYLMKAAGSYVAQSPTQVRNNIHTLTDLHVTQAEKDAIAVVGGKEDAITKGLGYLTWSGTGWVWDNNTYALPQSSVTDTTAGRAMIVGAFGLGSRGDTVTNLNTTGGANDVNRFRHTDAVVTGMPTGAARGGYFQIGYATSERSQMYFDPANGKVFVRHRYSATADIWKNWEELYHTGNLPDYEPAFITLPQAKGGLGQAVNGYAINTYLWKDGSGNYSAQTPDAVKLNIHGVNDLHVTQAEKDAIAVVGSKEDAITKGLGYLTWSGTGWVWKNETYALSSHHHDSVYGRLAAANTWTANNAFNARVGIRSDRVSQLDIRGNYVVDTQALGSVANTTAYFTNEGNYGLAIFVKTSGRSYLQNMRSDANTAFYDLVLQGLGGNVAVGKESVTAGFRFDVNGKGKVVASGNDGQLRNIHFVTVLPVTLVPGDIYIITT